MARYGKAGPYVLVIAGAAAGGVAPAVTKLLLQQMPMAALLTARYGIAAAVLTAAAAAARPRLRGEGRAPVISLIAVAALASGAGAFAFTASLYSVPAAVSNALSKAGPVFVAVLAQALLLERVGAATWGLLAAMVVASSILTARGTAGPAAGIFAGGVLLALAAGLLRALGEVSAKSALSGYSPTAVTWVRLAGGAGIAAAVAGATGDLRTLGSLAPGQWLLLAILGGPCTAGAIWLYYTGAARCPIHIAAGLRTIGVISTAFASWAMLGEGLAAAQWLGIGSLIAAAYALATAAPVARRPVSLTPLQKLTLGVAAGAALAVLASGGLLAVQLRAGAMAQMERTVRHTAALVAEVIRASPRPNRILLQRYFKQLVSMRQGEGPAFAYVVLTDADGNPIAWAFDQKVAAGPGAKAAQMARDVAYGSLRLPRAVVRARAHISSEGVNYVLHAGLWLEWLVRPLATLVLRTLLVAAAVAVGAGAIAWWAARAAAGPLAAGAAEVLARVDAAERGAMASLAQAIGVIASGPWRSRAASGAAVLLAGDAAEIARALAGAPGRCRIAGGGEGAVLCAVAEGEPEAEAVAIAVELAAEAARRGLAAAAGPAEALNDAATARLLEHVAREGARNRPNFVAAASWLEYLQGWQARREGEWVRVFV